MDAKVIWKNGLSFDGTSKTGFVVPLGADPAVGGANDGFRPLELLAISLAGCTAMDVVSIVRKKQQELTAFEVNVHAGQQKSQPPVFTEALITYRVHGRRVDEAAVRRAIELSVTKYCPVQAMLSRAFPIRFVYEIYEDDEEAQQPAVKGEWQLA